jgi:hypothetical protein
MKEPVEGEHPPVESWIARKLRNRGETELRAVTQWVRLSEEGEKEAHIWSATVDGKGWGCPVGGRVIRRTADGKVKVRLPGWSPVGAEIKGGVLSAETGSRRIAVVDTGGVDQSGRAYVALFVGPPPAEARRDGTSGNPHAITWRDFSSAKLKELRGKNKSVLVFCRADWDTTCAVLDRTLFADRRVIEAIKRLEYIPLRADFTNPSEEIKGFLREVAGRLGEATIVVFRGPRDEDPIVLQMDSSLEFISAVDLLDAMKRGRKAEQ